MRSVLGYLLIFYNCDKLMRLTASTIFIAKSNVCIKFNALKCKVSTALHCVNLYFSNKEKFDV